jgi:hypothetical protein
MQRKASENFVFMVGGLGYVFWEWGSTNLPDPGSARRGSGFVMANWSNELEKVEIELPFLLPT